MNPLFSRYAAQYPPDPDFFRIRQVLLCRGEPDRLPLFEVGIDDKVISTLLGEPVDNPAFVARTALKVGEAASADKQRYVEQLARAYHHLGYDYLMHLLASGSPEEVRAATRQLIHDCASEGGYALGSGNTIANYVPLENYFAMLDEARSA
jgi:hypothetical protein